MAVNEARSDASNNLKRLMEVGKNMCLYSNKEYYPVWATQHENFPRVTHPEITLVRTRLTAKFLWDLLLSQL
ncbi:hypothetical protein LXL04_025323 [Taraxacum kok-saghyz]